MNCISWIVLACIVEFIVLGFVHLDLVRRKDDKIEELQELLKPKQPDFAEDRVQRL